MSMEDLVGAVLDEVAAPGFLAVRSSMAAITLVVAGIKCNRIVRFDVASFFF
jgi:hypothetical protein